MSPIEFTVVALVAAMAVACSTSSEASDPSAPSPADLEGAWTVERIGDRPVIDASPAHVVFWEGGSLGGNASCNALRGTWTLEGERLSVKANKTARKTCIPSLTEQEERLMSALSRAERASFDRGLLVLSTSDGSQVLRASRRGEQNETATIRGTVGYRERIALRPGHTLEVTLSDVSLMDAPAILIARHTGEVTGQVPIPFELRYDPSRAVGGPRYAVRARILDPDGRLAWTSTTTHPVLEDGPGDETVEIQVERVAR